MRHEYAFSEAKCIEYLAQLDRLGVIGLRPLNPYRSSAVIMPSLAATLVERLRRVVHDFAQAHLAEQRLPEEQRTPYTLLVPCGPGFSPHSAT